MDRDEVDEMVLSSPLGNPEGEHKLEQEKGKERIMDGGQDGGHMRLFIDHIIPHYVQANAKRKYVLHTVHTVQISPPLPPTLERPW